MQDQEYRKLHAIDRMGEINSTGCSNQLAEAAPENSTDPTVVATTGKSFEPVPQQPSIPVAEHSIRRMCSNEQPAGSLDTSRWW
jgi:hypothetical protein